MVRLLIVALSLLFALPSFGGYSQPLNDVLTLGGPMDSSNPCNMPRGSYAKVVHLNATSSASTAGKFIGFSDDSDKSASQAQTQITGGTFVSCGFWVYGSISTTNYLGFGYGTAALASQGTTTPPAGRKDYCFGNMASALDGCGIPLINANFTGANPWRWFPFAGIKFPSGSYPYFMTGGAGADLIAVQMVGTIE